MLLSAKYALELRVIEVPGPFIPGRGRARGKDNMPSWHGILKNEEIEAIWAYIRATVDK